MRSFAHGSHIYEREHMSADKRCDDSWKEPGLIATQATRLCNLSVTILACICVLESLAGHSKVPRLLRRTQSCRYPTGKRSCLDQTPFTRSTMSSPSTTRSTGPRRRRARPRESKGSSQSISTFVNLVGADVIFLRLDLIIMPILTLGFFCLQLDRGNIANAITDKFMEDVGIDQDQFNVGQQMLSLGIVLFEIPSNMILYRVGPGKWLTLQLFLFGFVSLFQAFQHGYGAFIATRFLLGVTESGFIPGGLWTLSTWYTRKETAKRVMFFYFGNQFGQASSKLLAYGILHMRGVGGKPGWFWLFCIMGAFTVFCGFIYGFLLPDSFRNPHSTFLPFVPIFNEREVHILRSRVLLDDPAKGRKKKRIGLPAFKKAVCYGDPLAALHSAFHPCGNPQNKGLTGSQVL